MILLGSVGQWGSRNSGNQRRCSTGASLAHKILLVFAVERRDPMTNAQSTGDKKHTATKKRPHTDTTFRTSQPMSETSCRRDYARLRRSQTPSKAQEPSS
jgi:hypothetical protein